MRHVNLEPTTMPARLLERVRQEADALRRPGPRMIDEAECVVSVLLAIGFAHLLGAHNASWAAFSGYMVMRGHFAESALRGVLRIAGTVAGAAIALVIVPVVLPHPVAAAVAGMAIGGASLYGALTHRRAYGWLFVGLTFEMILLDKLQHPGDAIATFAATRVLEVAAGTAACLLVSFLSAATARRRWPAPPAAVPKTLGWHPEALRHAAQGAVALGLLSLLWDRFALPEPAQSSVTIMAAMLIPIGDLGRSGLVPVSRRLFHRAAGCLAGSAVAALLLWVAHGSAAVLLAGTCLGVVIGRHIENSRTAIAYVGTQFVLATLVVLVPDTDAVAHLAPAVERLTGALVGLALLEPVLLAWHLAIGLRARRTR